MLVFGSNIDKDSRYEIDIVKEGQYLYLKKPYDDKKEYRMNLANGQFERVNYYKKGIKISPVKVENITGWFTECSLFCDDEKFSKVIIYNKHLADNQYYRSPVRFIQTLTNWKTRNYEAWLSLGFHIYDIEKAIEGVEEKNRSSYYYGYRYHNSYITHSPQEFSKSALRYIRQFKSLSSDVIETIYRMSERNLDISLIGRLLNITNANPQYRDFFRVKQARYRQEDKEYNIFDLTQNDDFSHTRILECIIECITKYNLDVDAFLKFCLRAYHVECLDIVDLFQTRHYEDYLKMEKALKNNQMRKMNKYPKNFLTTFHIAKQEYKIRKQELDEQAFVEQCDNFRYLEEKQKEYSIVVPKQIADIEKEADELRHCVRMYIPKVIEGKTLICFLRENENLDTPLITIEVKDGSITQAYGLQDSRPKEKELDILRAWAKKHSLKLSWAWGL